MSGARVIGYERDVTAADLKTNDAYDLTLLQLPNRNYELVLFMKLQFFFEDKVTVNATKSIINRLTWTGAAKAKYVADFVARVNATFNGRHLTTLANGRRVTLRTRFQTQIGGFMLDHWEVTVRFVDFGERSNVDHRKGNVNLGSTDLLAVTRKVCKPGQKMCSKRKQIVAVHEFAHMIGLADEYGPSLGGNLGPWNHDDQSLLHAGTTLRPRHKQFLIDWVSKALARANEHWAGETPPA